jgi:CheY-like chemotaxis protein
VHGFGDGPHVALQSFVTAVTESLHPLTVLVVDDDPDIRSLLSGLLSKAGYHVEMACSGAEAILMLEQMPTPAALLVDLLMPGIVGQELLEYVRATPRLATIPVAIVSGSPELAPSGYRLFKKPVAFRELLAFVRQSCPEPTASHP